MSLELDKRQRAMLREMGIRLWQAPGAAAESPVPARAAARPAAAAVVARVAGLGLGGCKVSACGLGLLWGEGCAENASCMLLNQWLVFRRAWQNTCTPLCMHRFTG